MCLSLCSSVSVTSRTRHFTLHVSVIFNLQARALIYSSGKETCLSACKWWVTNHGRLIRRYYSKAILKSGLFMSPCNESQVALWLWCFFFFFGAEDEWFCLMILFWKLCGCEICTRECLRRASVLYTLYISRLTIVLPGTMQLWICDHDECLLFGLLLHNSVAMSYITVWNNAGDPSLSSSLFFGGGWVVGGGFL